MNAYTRWYLLRRKKARVAASNKGPFFSSNKSFWSDTTPVFGNT